MANTYALYKDARNAAWNVLRHFGVCALPVQAEDILTRMRVPVLPYPSPEMQKRLWDTLRDASQSPCCSLQMDGTWRVFIDRTVLTPAEQNFALAHELAHIVLRHETLKNAQGVRTFAGAENAGDILDAPQSPDDYTADIFAVRLLAPACVLHDLHITNAAAAAALCSLPPKAAALRAERMALLNDRGVFYTLPIEKQVHDLFLPFIRRQLQAQQRLAPRGAAPVKAAPEIHANTGASPDTQDSMPQKAPPVGERKKKRTMLVIAAAALAVLAIAAAYLLTHRS